MPFSRYLASFPGKSRIVQFLAAPNIWRDRQTTYTKTTTKPKNQPWHVPSFLRDSYHRELYPVGSFRLHRIKNMHSNYIPPLSDETTSELTSLYQKLGELVRHRHHLLLGWRNHKKVEYRTMRGHTWNRLSVVRKYSCAHILHSFWHLSCYFPFDFQRQHGSQMQQKQVKTIVTGQHWTNMELTMTMK